MVPKQLQKESVHLIVLYVDSHQLHCLIIENDLLISVLQVQF